MVITRCYGIVKGRRQSSPDNLQALARGQIQSVELIEKGNKPVRSQNKLVRRHGIRRINSRSPGASLDQMRAGTLIIKESGMEINDLRGVNRIKLLIKIPMPVQGALGA